MQLIMKAFKTYSVALIVFLFIGCQSNIQVQRVTGYALGTSYSVTYFDTKTNPEVLPAIDSVFYALNKSMSTYIPNSDISRINRGDQQVVVDHHFKTVLKKSQFVWKTTYGYFDPTVGTLVNAYGFGPENRIDSMTASVRDSLLTLTGLQKVTLTADDKIVKENPNIYIDFNAIGKGYAVDVLVELLHDQFRYENILVEIGGELRAVGINSIKNTPWTVAIDTPVNDNEKRDYLRTLQLSNQALATSGNYRKYRIDDAGDKYVHTINPLDGRAKASSILSASVIASDCMTADAYATAFMSMPLSLVDGFSIEGIEYLLVLSSEEGDYSLMASPGFPKLNFP
jgi:thiamine biosynthesis lipoprotein